MSKQVPDFINPFRAAEGGVSIAGRVAFSRMGRLSGVIENPEGEADVVLKFAVDALGKPQLHGEVRSEVVLICQRCLEPMNRLIDVEMDLGIVGSDEEAKRLPGNLDPWVVGDKPVSVAELIEDEILLALPTVPRHNDEDCAAAVMGQDGEASAGGDHPFALLAQIKAKR